MKIRFCAALLLAALSITLFTGCATAAGQPLDAPNSTMSLSSQPAALLTREEVIAIALKDAGLEETQVTQLRAELDSDRGRAEYEVDFHHDRWEYDYEIDAETGRIISFDKDWDD